MNWGDVKELIIIVGGSLALIMLWCIAVVFILALPAAVLGSLVWVVIFVLQTTGVIP